MDPITIGLGAAGLLSGIMGSNSAAHQQKMQMMSRAADQEAAPYLAKAGTPTSLTPYSGPTNGMGDILGGTISGLQFGSKLKSTEGENEDRQLMKQLLMGNNPKVAADQTAALQGMGPIGGLSQEQLQQYMANR